jgi:hypothetical protein
VRFVLFSAVAAALFCADASPSHSKSIKTYRHLILDGYSLKWGEPVLGSGAAVTYAFGGNVGALRRRPQLLVDDVLEWALLQ